MHRFIRWAALALFCAAWGFAGAFGAVWLAADRMEALQGPRGAPGPPGSAADIRPVIGVIAERLQEGRDRDLQLDARVSAVEGRVLTTRFCSVFGSVQVVSHVELRPGPLGPASLGVSTERLCLG